MDDNGIVSKTRIAVIRQSLIAKRFRALVEFLKVMKRLGLISNRYRIMLDVSQSSKPHQE